MLNLTYMHIYITIFSVQRSLFGLILFNLLPEFMLYLTYFSLFLVQRVLCSSILFDFQLIPMSMLITSLAQGSLRSSSRCARVPSLPLVKLGQTLSWKKGISWPLGSMSLRSEVLRATLMVRSMGLVTTWEWYIWGKIFFVQFYSALKFIFSKKCLNFLCISDRLYHLCVAWKRNGVHRGCPLSEGLWTDRFSRR